MVEWMALCSLWYESFVCFEVQLVVQNTIWYAVQGQHMKNMLHYHTVYCSQSLVSGAPPLKATDSVSDNGGSAVLATGSFADICPHSWIMSWRLCELAALELCGAACSHRGSASCWWSVDNVSLNNRLATCLQRLLFCFRKQKKLRCDLCVGGCFGVV